MYAEITFIEDELKAKVTKHTKKSIKTYKKVYQSITKSINPTRGRIHTWGTGDNGAILKSL